MRLLLTSVILFGVWLLLSGTVAPFYLAVGAVSAVAVAANFIGWDDETRFRPFRFLAFVPWLAWQIILSNLRLARLVLSVRMPIRPTFISQPPGVKGSRALATLASGVTLTPGTLAVDVSDGEIFVHALDVKSAEDVRANVMAGAVSRVYRAPAEPGETPS